MHRPPPVISYALCTADCRAGFAAGSVAGRALGGAAGAGGSGSGAPALPCRRKWAAVLVMYISTFVSELHNLKRNSQRHQYFNTMGFLQAVSNFASNFYGVCSRMQSRSCSFCRKTRLHTKVWLEGRRNFRILVSSMVRLPPETLVA